MKSVRKPCFEIHRLEERIAPTLALVGLDAGAAVSVDAAASLNVLNLANIGLSTGITASPHVATGIGLL